MTGKKPTKKTKAQKEKLRLKRQKKKAEADPSPSEFVKLAGLPDRRAMERTMANLFRRGASTPLAKAQDLMYDAWSTRDPRERVRLANAALEISRDCADAYVLLVEETARTVTKRCSSIAKGSRPVNGHSARKPLRTTWDTFGASWKRVRTCAPESMNVWKMTPGALEWLSAQFARV